MLRVSFIKGPYKEDVLVIDSVTIFQTPPIAKTKLPEAYLPEAYLPEAYLPEA